MAEIAKTNEFNMKNTVDNYTYFLNPVCRAVLSIVGAEVW